MRRRLIFAPVVALILIAVFGAITRSAAKAKEAKTRLSAESRAVLRSASLPHAALGAAADVKRNPERDAYFGETHVHTSWSFDAYIFGNHVTGPEDAYKYFQGETIKHPLGYDIKIDTPLDWAGVTDHSEYAGVVRLSNDPSSPISKLPIAKTLIVHDPADIQRIYLTLGASMIESKPIPELVKPEVAGTVWTQNNKYADEANNRQIAWR